MTFQQTLVADKPPPCTCQVGHMRLAEVPDHGVAGPSPEGLDVLDAEAPTATLGKTAGKDAEQGKPTYVSAMGVAQARSLAGQLREEALAAIAPFGARGARLAQLADFIVLRQF